MSLSKLFALGKHQWAGALAWFQDQFCYHTDALEHQLAAVPYYAQWESPELIASILNKTISATTDPRWPESGASSPEEYMHWSWNVCGMACLKMILAHQQKKVVPLVVLAKQCLSFGGYQKPLASSAGLFYQPFCTFVATTYGLQAHAVAPMTIPAITHALAQNQYVIASVSYEIRTPQIPPTRRGGHLILIIGYNKTTRTIYFHNPSGISPETQENVAMSFDEFEQFFAHKGIVLSTS